MVSILKTVVFLKDKIRIINDPADYFLAVGARGELESASHASLPGGQGDSSNDNSNPFGIFLDPSCHKVSVSGSFTHRGRNKWAGRTEAESYARWNPLEY